MKFPGVGSYNIASSIDKNLKASSPRFTMGRSERMSPEVIAKSGGDSVTASPRISPGPGSYLSSKANLNGPSPSTFGNAGRNLYPLTSLNVLSQVGSAIISPRESSQSPTSKKNQTAIGERRHSEYPVSQSGGLPGPSSYHNNSIEILKVRAPGFSMGKRVEIPKI